MVGNSLQLPLKVLPDPLPIVREAFASSVELRGRRSSSKLQLVVGCVSHAVSLLREFGPQLLRLCSQLRFHLTMFFCQSGSHFLFLVFESCSNLLLFSLKPSPLSLIPLVELLNALILLSCERRASLLHLSSEALQLLMVFAPQELLLVVMLCVLLPLSPLFSLELLSPYPYLGLQLVLLTLVPSTRSLQPARCLPNMILQLIPLPLRLLELLSERLHVSLMVINSRTLQIESNHRCLQPFQLHLLCSNDGFRQFLFIFWDLFSIVRENTAEAEIDCIELLLSLSLW